MCICCTYIPILTPSEKFVIISIISLQNRGMLVVGRIISGISVGLASAVVPIYQSEITAPAIRGRMVSLQQWLHWLSSKKIYILTRYLGLLLGAFWSNTLFNLVVHTSTASLLSEFLGVSKWFPLSSLVSECWFSLRVRVSFSIMDSEFNITYACNIFELIYLFSQTRHFKCWLIEGDKSNVVCWIYRVLDRVPWGTHKFLLQVSIT